MIFGKVELAKPSVSTESLKVLLQFVKKGSKKECVSTYCAALWHSTEYNVQSWTLPSDSAAQLLSAAIACRGQIEGWLHPPTGWVQTGFPGGWQSSGGHGSVAAPAGWSLWTWCWQLIKTAWCAHPSVNPPDLRHKISDIFEQFLIKTAFYNPYNSPNENCWQWGLWITHSNNCFGKRRCCWIANALSTQKVNSIHLHCVGVEAEKPPKICPSPDK